MAGTPSNINFQLSTEAYSGLSTLVAHGAALSLLPACAEKAGPAASFNRIAKLFSDAGKIPLKDAQTILSTLWNLYEVKRNLNLTAADLVSTLTAYLERSAPEQWQKENIQIWHKLTSRIRELFDPDNPLALDQKGVRLTYAHQNVMGSANIITDLRPVFTNDAKKVKGIVISHQLIIEYYDGHKAKRLHVVIDNGDLKRLFSLCKRAKIKAQTATAELTRHKLPTSIAGSEETTT